MSGLTCGSLFSGVGGMDVGLAWAGFRHAFFAELDPYARAVLAARFPGVHIYEDVRDVGAAAEGKSIDLLAGGFPCQDLSVAGKRAGLAGERSGLFHEFVRVADAFRPRALLVENVEGLYSSDGGRDFGVVLDALAERGYLVAWRTLDAQHFGVPQRRRRVFVLAIADGDPGAERLGEVLALAEGGGGDSPTSDPTWPLTSPGTRGGASRNSGDDAVSAFRMRGFGDYASGETASTVKRRDYKDNTDLIVERGEVRRPADDATYYIEDCERGPVKAGGAGGSPPRTDRLPLMTTAVRFSHTQGLDAQPTDDGTPTLRRNGGGMAAGVGSTVRRLTPLECERLMGWPDGWTDVPWNGKEHAPDSRRYAACGNGVVAPVAYWIGARLAEVLRER